jgi:hypothetical protein
MESEKWESGKAKTKRKISTRRARSWDTEGHGGFGIADGEMPDES